MFAHLDYGRSFQSDCDAARQIAAHIVFSITYHALKCNIKTKISPCGEQSEYLFCRTDILPTERITNGEYGITAGQADWAWVSGVKSDGVKNRAGDVPEIKSNFDDLEIVNGTTWNENIVCTRDVK
ncbi:MAG: hypothetical protein VZR73_17340, partial [Acutalibacteraceae bacterium]|nr:hypothetical protein [Acutalibacteraceae bacterium]